MPGFAFAETVTRIRRTAVGQNLDGNDAYAEVSTDIGGCVVWPTTASTLVGQGLRIEQRSGGQSTTTSGVNVLLPAGTALDSDDALIVRGKRYDVEGDPAVFHSPFTGTNPGVLARLIRVEG